MKYFSQTLFSAETLSAGIQYSDPFDISEASTIWTQCFFSGTNASTSITVQFQISLDSLSTLSSLSTWFNEGNSTVSTGSEVLDKHDKVCAIKARVAVTLNAGSGVATLISVGKPI